MLDARVKALSLEEAPVDDDDPWAAGETDPTIANAGLNELDTAQTHIANGTDAASEPDTPAAPPTGLIQEGAGNAAAEEQWDAKVTGEEGMDESFEIIPRDPAETENPHIPAVQTSTQSWADDTPTPGENSWSMEPTVVAAAPQAANGNDGFSEVKYGGRGGGGRGVGGERGGYRGRGSARGGEGGRGRGRGDGRSRGGRGDGQGRGGDGRPRGRGGPRGGAPRGESS